MTNRSIARSTALPTASGGWTHARGFRLRLGLAPRLAPA